MYRLRKSWNNGKWTPDQLGAYNELDNAIADCTSDRISEGYKVFDSAGNVVYPSRGRDIAKMLKADGVSVNAESLQYWIDAIDGRTELKADYVATIIEGYHNALADAHLSNGSATDSYAPVIHDSVKIYPIDLSKFKIKYVDASKISACRGFKMRFNLGYFANFAENGTNFTLPVANLVADIDFDTMSDIAKRYIKERPYTDTKVSFSTSQNAGNQFKGKTPSTLIVENGKAAIERTGGVSLGMDYAVSGAPIMTNGKPSGTQYLEEGWDNSIVRATNHGFLGTKPDGSLYYFTLVTASKNCITSNEVYDKIKTFGFDNVIKVDGGGSFIFTDNDGNTTATSEPRRINNIGGIF